MALLDTSLFIGNFKYYITKDSLYVKIDGNTFSNSKIVLLTEDSLILSQKGSLDKYIKISK